MVPHYEAELGSGLALVLRRGPLEAVHKVITILGATVLSHTTHQSADFVGRKMVW